jgi:hypothetical protein
MLIPVVTRPGSKCEFRRLIDLSVVKRNARKSGESTRLIRDGRSRLLTSSCRLFISVHFLLTSEFGLFISRPVKKQRDG